MKFIIPLLIVAIIFPAPLLANPPETQPQPKVTGVKKGDPAPRLERPLLRNFQQRTEEAMRLTSFTRSSRDAMVSKDCACGGQHKK